MEGWKVGEDMASVVHAFFKFLHIILGMCMYIIRFWTSASASSYNYIHTLYTPYTLYSTTRQ